jgi:hypothetical protein
MTKILKSINVKERLPIVDMNKTYFTNVGEMYFNGDNWLDTQNVSEICYSTNQKWNVEYWYEEILEVIIDKNKDFVSQDSLLIKYYKCQCGNTYLTTKDKYCGQCGNKLEWTN